RGRGIHPDDPAPRDAGENEGAVRDVGEGVLGAERRLAGDLHGAVDTVYRQPHRAPRAASVTHDRPPSSLRLASTLTISRCARAILKALSRWARAPSSSRAAAARKVSTVAGAPTRTRSAARARHGLWATPPSARRASRMVPSATSRAAATETRAKA